MVSSIDVSNMSLWVMVWFPRVIFTIIIRETHLD